MQGFEQMGSRKGFAPFILKVLPVTAVLLLLLSSFFAALYRADGEEGSAYLQNKKNGSMLSTIYGRALYHGTERPVGLARIVLRSVNSFGPEEIVGSITNSRGEFHIKGVPA